MTLTDDKVRAIDEAARVLIRLVDGMWTLPGEGEPDAVVTYSAEPSPKWMWWARGIMGAADSYEGARGSASEALRRLVSRG